jgi:hypothetical protein
LRVFLYTWTVVRKYFRFVFLSLGIFCPSYCFSLFRVTTTSGICSPSFIFVPALFLYVSFRNLGNYISLGRVSWAQPGEVMFWILFFFIPFCFTFIYHYGGRRGNKLDPRDRGGKSHSGELRTTEHCIQLWERGFR